MGALVDPSGEQCKTAVLLNVLPYTNQCITTHQPPTGPHH